MTEVETTVQVDDMETRTVEAEVPVTNEEETTVRLCDACGREARASVGFAITDVDAEMKEELDLEAAFNLDMHDDMELHLFASCTKEGPATALRFVDTILDGIMKEELELAELYGQKKRMGQIILLASAVTLVASVLFGPHVLVGAVAGVVFGFCWQQGSILRTLIEAREQT